MELFKLITEIIKQRKSCRTFEPKPIEKEILEKITDSLANITVPFGSKVRFQLIDISNLPDEESKKLGTYRIIKGAKTFITGAVVSDSAKCWEDFGYGLEKIILFATQFEIGTCWLGGTFNRASFSKKINLQPNEILPAITPIGYPAQKSSLTDSAIRKMAGSDKRKLWNELFFKESFNDPLNEAGDETYYQPLSMLRLAPSASNRQPCRIVKQNNKFHFYLQRTTGYNKLVSVDLQRIDMGIAMCHFELTAKHIGLKGEWITETPSIINLLPRTEYIVSWVEK